MGRRGRRRVARHRFPASRRRPTSPARGLRGEGGGKYAGPNLVVPMTAAKPTPGLPERLELDNIDNATVYEVSGGGSSIAFSVNLYLARPGENEALAAEIARRWNAHADLVAFVERTARGMCYRQSPCENESAEWACAYCRARALLARIGGAS